MGQLASSFRYIREHVHFNTRVATPLNFSFVAVIKIDESVNSLFFLRSRVISFPRRSIGRCSPTTNIEKERITLASR